jgi:hypothetical protein
MWHCPKTNIFILLLSLLIFLPFPFMITCTSQLLSFFYFTHSIQPFVFAFTCKMSFVLLNGLSLLTILFLKRFRINSLIIHLIVQTLVYKMFELYIMMMRKFTEFRTSLIILYIHLSLFFGIYNRISKKSSWICFFSRNYWWEKICYD